MAFSDTNAFTITISPPGVVTAGGTADAQNATGSGLVDRIFTASGTATSQNATGSGNVAISSSIPFVEITLTDESGTPIPNLTGLKYAWFDEASPDLFTSVVETGSDEVTDANGLLVIGLSTTSLTIGQTGWLDVTDSDGNPATNHKGFSGPVTLVAFSGSGG